MIKRFHRVDVLSQDDYSLCSIEVDIDNPIAFAGWWYRTELPAILRDTYTFYWTYTRDRRFNYRGYFRVERQGVRDRVHMKLCMDGEVEDKVYDLYTFERKFFGRRGKRPDFEMHVTVVVK